MSLSDTLLNTFKQEKQTTVASLMKTFGSESFGFLAILLSLPIALPATPPGVSIPFGLVLITLSIQMLIGKEKLWLPGFIANRKVNLKGENKFLDKMASWLKFFERITHKRQTWIFKQPGYTFLALAMLTGSLIMLLPLPVINSVASGICLLIGMSLVEKDGLLGLGGILVSAGCIIATLIIFIFFRQLIGQ